MSQFKHILITRFNLSKKWDSDKFGNTILDENWLKDRYELFENYCLPSIKAQTNKNFEWWVYFDKETDDFYKEKNNTIKSEFPNFIPFYEESYDDFEHNLPLDLFNKIKIEDKEWLITSRLDNDDMLANDTIDVIQKGFENKDMLLLEIPYGLTMQVAEYNCLRKFKSKLNPFISLIECITNKTTTKSVFYHQHNQWTSVETKNVSKKTQWIQVIHEKNVFNRANGYLTYTFGKLNRFTFLDKDIKFEKLKTVVNKKTKRTLRLIKKKILNE